MATASHRALRPARIAPSRSGPTPRARAANRTLIVRLARPALMRRAGVRHFTGVTSSPRSTVASHLDASADQRLQRLLVFLVPPSLSSPPSAFGLLPEVQDGQ